jgi:hypothetical protein
LSDELWAGVLWENGASGWGGREFIGVTSATLRTGSSTAQDDSVKQTTTKNRQRQEQATARTGNGKNKQRQEQKQIPPLPCGMTNKRTDNGAIRRFWLRQNDDEWGLSQEDGAGLSGSRLNST